MPAFDQWTVQNDNATLSAGQTIKFDIRAFCLPFAAPSTDDINLAFSQTSMNLVDVSADLLSLENGATIKAALKEVVTVGALRAQILAAGNIMNSTKSVPCSDFAIVDDQISLLTAPGTGVELPSSTGLGIGLGTVLGVVVLIVAFALYRDLRVA
jgi:hypothetical protein